MRLHNNPNSGRIAKACLLLMTTAALAACGAVGGGARPAPSIASAMPANGPQADYPVLIGAPYNVDSTRYTPADVLNYDEVGYLAAGTGEGISGAHHTLPVPSYVEVTSLETGRTILLRLEQRGPMDSNHLLALSPAAMEQLGGNQDNPIRVRRVNPPEDQRALLRSDQAAPLRMDTPMSLVTVLRRRLPEEGSASLRAAHSAATPEPLVAAIVPAPAPVQQPAPVTAEIAPPVPEEAPLAALPPLDVPDETENFDPERFDEAFASVEVAPAPTPAPAPAQVTQTADGEFLVQAAAFSTQERADRVADALGGQVSQSGQFFRVRTGPFTTRAQAEASLANVRAAGYSDARILNNG